MSAITKTSYENITPRLRNHFSIIPRSLVCQTCNNYPGIKLVGEAWRQKEKVDVFWQVLTSSTLLQTMSIDTSEGTRRAYRIRTDGPVTMAFLPHCTSLWCYFFHSLARAGAWLVFNGKMLFKNMISLEFSGECWRPMQTMTLHYECIESQAE